MVPLTAGTDMRIGALAITIGALRITGLLTITVIDIEGLHILFIMDEGELATTTDQQQDQIRVLVRELTGLLLDHQTVPFQDLPRDLQLGPVQQGPQRNRQRVLVQDLQLGRQRGLQPDRQHNRQRDLPIDLIQDHQRDRALLELGQLHDLQVGLWPGQRVDLAVEEDFKPCYK